MGSRTWGSARRARFTPGYWRSPLRGCKDATPWRAQLGGVRFLLRRLEEAIPAICSASPEGADSESSADCARCATPRCDSRDPECLTALDDIVTWMVYFRRGAEKRTPRRGRRGVGGECCLDLGRRTWWGMGRKAGECLPGGRFRGMEPTTWGSRPRRGGMADTWGKGRPVAAGASSRLVTGTKEHKAAAVPKPKSVPGHDPTRRQVR